MFIMVFLDYKWRVQKSKINTFHSGFHYMGCSQFRSTKNMYRKSEI